MKQLESGQTTHCLKGLLAALTVSACLLAAETADARAITPQEERELTRIVQKVTASGAGALSAKELIELGDLQNRLGQQGRRATLDSFFYQLVWSWAAERGLTAETALVELLQAYAETHDRTPGDFQQALQGALAGLPAPGSESYRPPTYLFQPPVAQVRRFSVIGKPPFGPNFNSGMSRLSNGAVGRRP